ncbi:MAG TPA: IS1595 family transposase [Candidatus Sulfotelmatobacter sp.]|jgi:transposase-like protein|nr:IS1595 family transposase [Candidatus Sulfotelmatobacter sp.]
MQDTIPQILQEAIKVFSDEQVCIDAVAMMRWTDGPRCPDCLGDKAKNPYYLKTQKRWKCRECRRQFSVKVGTIFEDSPISLQKWLPAMWMLVNCKNGISSWELHRALGVSQKSAWFMLQRLRLALKAKDLGFKLGGKDSSGVETDETFVGGRLKNMHRNKQTKYMIDSRGPNFNKTVVHGMLDRDLRQVRASVVPNTSRETLQTAVLKNVKYGSRLYSDEAVAYDKMNWRFVHEVVNKTETYVRGQVHVNGMENFWALLKRGLKGTYVAVEPFHLERYVDEQVFRFNNRATKDNPLKDSDRFLLALSQVAGKRLTFAELTGKDKEIPF